MDAIPGKPQQALRDLPSDDRPRERLLAHGPETLSDAELIALILGSGTRGENVLELARGLLKSSAGLGGLIRADAKAMQQARGLGPARAAQLLAAFELGRRFSRLSTEDRPMLKLPEAVFAYLGHSLSGRRQEELHVLALDNRGRLLGHAVPYRGTMHSVPIRAAEVLREAIIQVAATVVLVHNHPSGDPTPSAADVALTRNLFAAAAPLDIEVGDHVIIGQDRFCSMRREGYMAYGEGTPGPGPGGRSRARAKG